jgi:hypothetical protein
MCKAEWLDALPGTFTQHIVIRLTYDGIVR